ncbi:DUF1653 domain-containing protein [Acetobacter senegalensis]|uniref:DUF1653 domain-containing protein n=1 Tax=Acetobacter senegalensis TaxID=446692 RepID=UPI00265213ED|nr:DUF1653 domain-containing protein [Acetobacter senegalensis]MDN7349945.1 DUF1653 domain-containing protein [Acetobacter senegalensis]
MNTHAQNTIDTTMPEHPRPGLYRHYKGGLYTVLCVGRHSETEEWLVTYRSEVLGSYWVRPLAMWQEQVNGIPRFALIEETASK